MGLAFSTGGSWRAGPGVGRTGCALVIGAFGGVEVCVTGAGEPLTTYSARPARLRRPGGSEPSVVVGLTPCRRGSAIANVCRACSIWARVGRPEPFFADGPNDGL